MSSSIDCNEDQFQHGWTTGFLAILCVANVGLILGNGLADPTLEVLQFDRDAIFAGELWRLVTGNFVHWSLEHFLLDALAFAVLGWMYDPQCRCRDNGSLLRLDSLPMLILLTSAGIGISLLAFQPQLMTYRGFSGVDSGLFAVVIVSELMHATDSRRKWLCVVPAAIVFVAKLAFEVTTGDLFFATDSLGELGQPVPLAHAAGAAIAAGLFILSNTTAVLLRRVPTKLA